VFQNDALKRENDTVGDVIIRSGKPDLGFPPEQKQVEGEATMPSTR
jgi:hypothetical protein